VIATRGDDSNDNFAVLDFVEDDGTSGIVPPHDIEKILANFIKMQCVTH
jgi:hypothetical protein